MPSRPLLFLLSSIALLGGCGSKISEANYFRVQYGMTEKQVEDLLGPAHEESLGLAPPLTDVASSRPASTRSVGRKEKAWSRGAITIRIVFDGGVVVARSAEGIAAEPPASRPINRPNSHEV